MTAHDPLSFAETICGHPVSYIRIETIEGKRTCILVDEDGDIKWVLFLDEGATETDGALDGKAS